MGRFYSVSFENVSVAAAQDLLQIKGAANKVLRIHRVWWGGTNTTLAASQELRTRCRFLPATVTDGSGGSAPAPQKLSPGDAAASLTALANNTTPASSSGTAVVLAASGDHLYNGFALDFSRQPEIPPSTAFTLELLSTPSGTITLSGGALVEEIG